MPTHFIVHDKADTVGVVVVEDVQPEKNYRLDHGNRRNHHS